MSDQNLWSQMVEQDPEHSVRYAERFRAMRAAGQDLAGEARLVDAMLPREARVLDAGCGSGRVGALLHDAGHEVVGVDLDPVLIAVAEQDHPGPRWLVGDLATLDPTDLGIDAPFDVIVCAGNVMTFVAPNTRVEVLRRLRSQPGDEGRLVVGFGTDRGYEVGDFLGDAAAVGLEAEVLLSSWHLHPYREGDLFLVAMFSSPDAGSPTTPAELGVAHG